MKYALPAGILLAIVVMIAMHSDHGGMAGAAILFISALLHGHHRWKTWRTRTKAAYMVASVLPLL
ncbi:MAG: hypothetical protein ABIT83_01745 [Massilia sp.]